MKHAFALALVVGLTTAAQADVYNIPGSALTLKTLSSNYMSGAGITESTAPVNYVGIGRVCSVTMMSAKHSSNGKLTFDFWKHTAAVHGSIDAQPVNMAHLTSQNRGGSTREIQFYTQNGVLSPDVDSSKDFLFVTVHNAGATLVMGITVDIRPECPSD